MGSSGGAGKKRAPRWAKHQQRHHASPPPTTTTTTVTASNLPKSSLDDAAPDSTTPASSSSHPPDYALPSCSTVPLSAEDAETARLVAEVLDKAEVDLRELRKIAVVKGLGTNALRARAWPLLLGARAGADDFDVLQRLSSSSSSSCSSSSSLHRDSAVVDVDVERSLWAFTRGWSEGARAAARAALRRVINASVAEASRELLEREGGGGGGGAQEKEEGGGGVAGERIGEEASASASASAASAPSLQQRRRRKGEEAPSSSNGNGNGTSPSTLPPSSSSSSSSPPSSAAAVHYYQGLHDVASVLLLVTGSEVAAFRLLRRLAGCQLRDFTRPTLDAALEACELLPRIVARADAQLGRALDPSRNPGAPPSHYALPWLLTWFAHSASSSLGVAAAARGGGGGGGKDVGENTAAEDAASNDDTLNSAARLFDLFAASHPFMPLYVAAAAIVADRRRLLAALAEGDPAEAHAALAKVRVFGVGERRVGELAAEAARLCRRHPPGELAREAQRQSRAAASARSSTAALARLGADGSWVVEDRISSGEKGSGKGKGGSGKGSGRSKRFGKDGVGNSLFLLKQLRSEQRARGVAAVALAAGVAALALFAGGPASIGGGGGGGGRG